MKLSINETQLFLSFVLFFVLFSCSRSEVDETSSMCSKDYLLYISKASGNFDIYKNDLSGNETRLTTNPSWDWSPMWNQATESIIYYSYVNDTFQIRRMDMDGNLLTLDSKGLLEFNLSPDGKTLIMEENRGDNRQLVLVSIGSLSRTPITDSISYNGRAKWSSDSKRIIYITDRDGNNEVYLYNLESKITDRLTVNNTSEKYLTWAPDNKRIAFTTEYYEEGKPDRNDVFVMDIDSKKVTQITNNPFEDSEIAWSPNGDRIAFHSKRDSVDHIFTMLIDGTDIRQVTSNRTYHGEPSWITIKTNCDELNEKK